MAQDSGRIYVVRGSNVESFDAPGVVQNPHLLTFSPSGRHAYVADVGNGRLHVVRTGDRRVVTSVSFPAGNDTHQAKPSPDGRVLLVTRRAGSQTLFKVLADERSGSWTLTTPSLAFGPARTPICSVFRRDGVRAYVSLAPSGIAVVDVASMTLVASAGTNGILPTDGLVACGLAESRDGRSVYAVSNGGGGHLYRLDMAADTITELSYSPGAVDLHYVALSADERLAFASSRGNDQLKVFELGSTTVRTIPLDPTPGQKDEPDGVTVSGNSVYVAMKQIGKVAVVDAGTGSVSFLDAAPGSTNALPHVSTRPLPPCVVPNVRGMTLKSARATLHRVGCSAGSVRKAFSRRVKRGRVIAQSPRARTELASGSAVALVVSRGAKRS